MELYGFQVIFYLAYTLPRLGLWAEFALVLLHLNELKRNLVSISARVKFSRDKRRGLVFLFHLNVNSGVTECRLVLYADSSVSVEMFLQQLEEEERKNVSCLEQSVIIRDSGSHRNVNPEPQTTESTSLIPISVLLCNVRPDLRNRLVQLELLESSSPSYCIVL